MAVVDHRPKLIEYARRLEREWPDEPSSSRRGKLIVRLALAYVALADERDPVGRYRRLHHNFVEVWDGHFDNVSWDWRVDSFVDELLDHPAEYDLDLTLTYANGDDPDAVFKLPGCS